MRAYWGYKGLVSEMGIFLKLESQADKKELSWEGRICSRKFELEMTVSRLGPQWRITVADHIT